MEGNGHYIKQSPHPTRGGNCLILRHFLKLRHVLIRGAMRSIDFAKGLTAWDRVYASQLRRNSRSVSIRDDCSTAVAKTVPSQAMDRSQFLRNWRVRSTNASFNYDLHPQIGEAATRDIAKSPIKTKTKMKETTKRIVKLFNKSSIFDHTDLQGIGSGAGFGFDLSPYTHMAILPSYWRVENFNPGQEGKDESKRLLHVLAVGMRGGAVEAFELPVWAVRRRGARRQDTSSFEETCEGYRSLMACKDDLCRLQYLNGSIWSIKSGLAWLSVPLKEKETEDDRRTFKVNRFAVVDKQVDDEAVIKKFVEFLAEEGLEHSLSTQQDDKSENE